MYNYDYIIKDFSNNEEYQVEFLNVTNCQDIDNIDFDELFDSIYDSIKNNEDWQILLKHYCNSIYIDKNISLDMGLPIGYSFSYIKQTHECLQEYHLYKTTNLVKEINKKFK